jgi:4-amino-4-deoxychorismate lyase
VTTALVNGVPGDALSLHDRGLLYGDGLFETITCVQGRPRWFERHLRRLALGCDRLGLASPDAALLSSELARLAHGTARCIVKIILTRGVATGRGYRPSGQEVPTRVLARHDWTPPPVGPFLVNLSPVRLGGNALLAGIKHLNRLEQVLAQRAAAAAGVHEALMRDGAGRVICGSMSNLFVPAGDELLTPEIADCGVWGIMRALVMATAPAIGLRVREAPLTAEHLAGAPSLFVTNVRLGVQPVHCYEGRGLETDARLSRLQEAVDAALG